MKHARRPYERPHDPLGEDPLSPPAPIHAEPGARPAGGAYAGSRRRAATADGTRGPRRSWRPSAWRRLGLDVASGGPRGWRRCPLRARLELARVTERELGLLFASAALFAGAGAAAREGWHGRLVLESPAAWRARARRLLADLDARERRQGVVRLLEHLLESPRRRWSAGTTLAALATRLAPGRTTALVEAQVSSEAGQHRRAERLLARLALVELDEHEAWRALHLLGRCHLAAGRVRLALGALEGACASPHCGVEALVESVAAAQLAGDAGRLQRAAARLDLLLESSDPAFRAALGGLRKRLCSLAPWPRSRGASTPFSASPAERVLDLVGR